MLVDFALMSWQVNFILNRLIRPTFSMQLDVAALMILELETVFKVGQIDV